MAKYLKPQAEIVKSISEIAAKLTIFDLISYMKLPLTDENESEEIASFQIKDNFSNNVGKGSAIHKNQIDDVTKKI